MDIILQKEAPLELVRIINQVCEGIENIKRVVIGASMPILDKNRALGAFDPETGTILIDMDNCMRDKRWMIKGCLFIPNVWFNLMYAVHHELIHAAQVLDNPSLANKEAEELLKEEEEANQMALDAVYSWFEQGGKIPPLEEMGYVGNSISELLNGLFSTMPQDVAEEINMLEIGAVARADVIVASHDHFNDKDLLYDEMDKGNIGILAGNKRYFTAGEFLAI